MRANIQLVDDSSDTEDDVLSDKCTKKEKAKGSSPLNNLVSRVTGYHLPAQNVTATVFPVHSQASATDRLGGESM